MFVVLIILTSVIILTSYIQIINLLTYFYFSQCFIDAMSKKLHTEYAEYIKNNLVVDHFVFFNGFPNRKMPFFEWLLFYPVLEFSACNPWFFFCMFHFKAVFAEEVGVLSERKSSLNRLEGCQDYIADFIDKIQSTQGHCLLVYKKRVS